MVGASGKDFARRLLDERYGAGAPRLPPVPPGPRGPGRGQGDPAPARHGIASARAGCLQGPRHEAATASAEARLIGSQAAHPGSDIDLLVVLPDLCDRRKMTVQIRRALGDLPVSKDIVVTTPAEIGRRGTLVGSVLRPALQEGKVVYERP